METLYGKLILPGSGEIVGTGWLPPRPDLRDYTQGDKGYGWMPYDYILNNLALDFWSLLGMEWVDSGQFGI